VSVMAIFRHVGFEVWWSPFSCRARDLLANVIESVSLERNCCPVIGLRCLALWAEPRSRLIPA